MTDEVDILIPRPKFNEGSAFTCTAYYRDRASSAPSAPAAAKYRVDCLTTRQTVQDWTSLSVSTSNSISITSTNNAILDASNTKERKQLTVASEPGAANQFRGIAVWDVLNLFGSP
jgi:hypothetical protein